MKLGVVEIDVESNRLFSFQVYMGSNSSCGHYVSLNRAALYVRLHLRLPTDIRPTLLLNVQWIQSPENIIGQCSRSCHTLQFIMDCGDGHIFPIQRLWSVFSWKYCSTGWGFSFLCTRSVYFSTWDAWFVPGQYLQRCFEVICYFDYHISSPMYLSGYQRRRSTWVHECKRWYYCDNFMNLLNEFLGIWEMYCWATIAHEYIYKR